MDSSSKEWHGRRLYWKTVVENPKLDATYRYRSLARKLLYLATKAADFEEVSQYVDSATDVLNKKIDEFIQKLLSAAPNGDGSLSLEDQSDLTLIDNAVENSSQKPATTFKRKIGRKGGRRLTSWVDKQPKRNKEKVTEKKEQNKNNGIPLLQSEPGSNEHVNSFMELLMVIYYASKMQLLNKINSRCSLFFVTYF
jgi:Mg-chelatase subunit ChlI